MIKAVFFDLDETLIDADYCHSRASRQAFKHFDLDYDQAKQNSLDFDTLGRRINDILEVRRNALGITEKQVSLNNLCQFRQKTFLNCVKQKAFLFPGAVNAVKQARSKAKIVAITSSGTRKYIKLALQLFKLGQYIDFIIGEQDVSKGKPDPEIYQKAFSLIPKDLNIKKSETLVVEDSINGVKAGKKAGLKVAFVPSKYTQGTIKADYHLKSFKNFHTIL